MSWRQMDHDDDSGANNYSHRQLAYVGNPAMLCAKSKPSMEQIDTLLLYANMMGIAISAMEDPNSSHADRISAAELARKLIIDMADYTQEDFDRVRYGNGGMA